MTDVGRDRRSLHSPFGFAERMDGRSYIKYTSHIAI
jgi:hypothetical protein